MKRSLTKEIIQITCKTYNIPMDIRKMSKAETLRRNMLIYVLTADFLLTRKEIQNYIPCSYHSIPTIRTTMNKRITADETIYAFYWTMKTDLFKLIHKVIM